MTLNGESLWQAIKKAVKSALFSESAWDSADKEVRKRLKKMNEAKRLDKNEYKAGFGDPISLALIFAGGLLLGSVFGHGVKTRSITTEINIRESRDIVVMVDGQKVEVSGSGGVSVPLTGGGK